MKKFAVGVIDFFNNDLNIQIIKADNWRDALYKHLSINPEVYFPNDLEEAKCEAFNMDMMIDVREITND